MSLAFDATAWPAIVIPDGPRAQCKRIIAATAERHGLSYADIVGDRRFAKHVACRQEAIALCVRDTSMSLVGIGRIVGKDHSTVIWAVRRFNTISGENIRGMGPVTPEILAAKRASSDRHREKYPASERTLQQRLRRSQLRRMGGAAS